MTRTANAPVRATDKVAAVLARDEKLVEVFASHSPQFAKLRNPGMRRVMARLVTVEQAAKICGAEPRALVHELNSALGFANADEGEDQVVTEAPVKSPAAKPAAPKASASEHVGYPWAPGAPITKVDVREDLRTGREPFSRIMAAAAQLGKDGVLCLRATFEPVPLFAVMAKRGYAHLAEELGEENWRVWFYPDGTAGEAEADDAEEHGGKTAESGSGSAEKTPDIKASTNEVVLDVRGLEPPEPMQRTLEALPGLADGAVLIHVNVRIPHFLLPILRERGYDYEIHEPEAGRVVVRIWRVGADPAA
jgi:hypothetical protein